MKAQVTAFIIIGMLIILFSGLLLYYVKQQTTAQLETPEIFVQAEALPTYNIVQNCLAQTATRAVELLGLQGGYVEIPSSIDTSPGTYLQIDPLGAFKIPFWYAEGTDKTPSLDNMQQEISRYVLENIPSCTDFAQLPDTTVNVQGQPSVQTIFGDKNVIVQLNWKLSIVTSDKTIVQEEFAAQLPVRLRTIWQLASSAMRAENNHDWFENLTVDWLAIDPAIPTDGMEFSCGQKTWHLSEIKKELSQVLYYNLPRIRVKNTNYLPFAEKTSAYEQLRGYTPDKVHRGAEPASIPQDSYEHNRLLFDAETPTTDLTAAFEYQPDWSMLINAQPNDAGTLISNVVRGPGLTSFLCTNQWHFAYNIIYPVRMIIRDNTAFDGKGYLFQFAFPVIIQNNEANRQSFSSRAFIAPVQDASFCDERGKEIYDIRASGIEDKNPIATELEGANIMYNCFKYTCDLGTTHADNGVYRLQTTLPSCTSPLITATKDNYLTARSQVAIKPSTPFAEQTQAQPITLNMKHLNTLQLLIYKHIYNPQTNTFGPAEPLSINDKATLRIQLRNEDKQTTGRTEKVTFEQVKEYPRDVSIQLLDETASYSIDALLTTTDIFTNVETLVGGYQSAEFTTRADSAAALEVHVFTWPTIPTSPSQDQQLATLLYGTSYQETLIPRVK